MVRFSTEDTGVFIRSGSFFYLDWRILRIVNIRLNNDGSFCLE